MIICIVNLWPTYELMTYSIVFTYYSIHLLLFQKTVLSLQIWSVSPFVTCYSWKVTSLFSGGDSAQLLLKFEMKITDQRILQNFRSNCFDNFTSLVSWFIYTAFYICIYLKKFFNIRCRFCQLVQQAGKC